MIGLDPGALLVGQVGDAAGIELDSLGEHGLLPWVLSGREHTCCTYASTPASSSGLSPLFVRTLPSLLPFGWLLLILYVFLARGIHSYLIIQGTNRIPKRGKGLRFCPSAAECPPLAGSPSSTWPKGTVLPMAALPIIFQFGLYRSALPQKTSTSIF